jgi:hypothetical protein
MTAADEVRARGTRRASALRALSVLAALVALARAADADPVAVVNSLRAEGCSDTPAVGMPVRRESALDAAARELAHTDGSLYWASPDGGIVRGSDDGQTWSERLGAGEIGSVRPIELPDRRIASVGPSGVALSNDRGASWYVVTTPLPFQTYGLVYSTFQRAFYVFHFSCNPETAVPEDAVMSYGFDYETE